RFKALIQPSSREVSIEEDVCGALPLQGHGIVALMIISCIGIWHQNRWLATGREFRQRTGSSATQDQVGPVVAVGHIVQERLDLCLQPHLCIGLGYLGTISLPGLVY